MTDPNRFTRRNVLRVGAASALGLGAIGTASGETSDGTPADLRDSAERLGPVDLSGLTDSTDTVAVSAVPEESTAIGPGSMLFIERGGSTAGCTANFVWESGDTLYLGAAGHCFLPEGAATGENTDPNGASLDITVRVGVDGTFGGLLALSGFEGTTVELGDVVYARQESDDGEGVGHDFGLVEIPQAVIDEGLVDPSMPQFGGPTGVEDGALPTGEPVCQYGNGVANGELFATKASRGLSLGDLGDPRSWYAGIRGSPGDSGSALLGFDPTSDPDGTDAAGVLTHLTTNGTAGTTMQRCVEMAREDVGLDIDPVLAGQL